MRPFIVFAQAVALPIVMLAGLSSHAWGEVAAYSAERLKTARESAPFVAVHLLKTDSVAELGRFAESIANEGAEAAGVRHIAIVPVEEAALAGAQDLPILVLADPGGAAVGALRAREGDLPATLIFAKDADRPMERTFERGGRALPNIRSMNARLFRAWRHPAIERFPLENGVALGGMDAVSYHGNSGPVTGTPSFASEYRGITYRFSSAGNRRTFVADPERYLPAAGGWCAVAMASGEQVEADVRSFIIHEGRLHVFYNGIFGDSREGFLGDEAGVARAAETNWGRIANPNSNGED